MHRCDYIAQHGCLLQIMDSFRMGIDPKSAPGPDVCLQAKMEIKLTKALWSCEPTINCTARALLEIAQRAMRACKCVMEGSKRNPCFALKQSLNSPGEALNLRYPLCLQNSPECIQAF